MNSFRQPDHRIISSRGILNITVCLAICLLSFSLGAEESVPASFNKIQQVLKNNCVKCHGPINKEGGLDLSSPAAIKVGGDSGSVIFYENLKESHLWKRVESGDMPPETPLEEKLKAQLKQWIVAGAPGLPSQVEPEDLVHWSFRKLPHTTAQTASPGTSPIDSIISEKLAAQQLQLSPEADLETLLRRVSLVLTGLPPSLEERRRFLRNPNESTYREIVEYYLASPHYGERWGKFWLDAAGYADSNGYFNADTDRPLAYRYRDYVVRSFNADKPFDQFVREQIAGDEISGFQSGQPVTADMIELLEATHYLRNAQDGTDSSDGNPDELRTDRYYALEGTMQIVSSSLLGLTIQCAKCHDHKFEPITQQEYYQFQSFFYPAFNIEQWKKPRERTVTAVLPGELDAWKAKKAETEEQIAQLETEFQSWVQQHRPQGEILFRDDFSDSNLDLKKRWSATAPGDDAPASPKPISIGEPDKSPSFYSKQGQLYVETSEAAGYDSYNSTTESFQWTPAEIGGWIQLSFDLIDNHIHADSAAAVRIGYGISLHDANDNSEVAGGNVIFEGAFPDGGAAVYFDHPGPDSKPLNKIGNKFYHPGHNYGVRITRQSESQLRLQHLVDGSPEGDEISLQAGDLSPGGFGFVYFQNRSFIVDNVLIESSPLNDPEFDSFAKKYEQEQSLRKKELEQQVNELKKQIGDQPGKIAWVADYAGEPPEVHLLLRGDHKTPGPAVEPIPFSVLSEPDNDFQVSPSSSHSTGRRSALANWLTQSNSRSAALMTRVQVNRIWQHYFGKGIVATPENLGMSGDAPSHPNLLEYLSSQLVEQQWQQKQIHRLILHSKTFKQTSHHRPRPHTLDPDNKLYWKFPRQRLDAEALRDSMLTVAGTLDNQSGGPYVPTNRSASGVTRIPESEPGARRRSLYLYQRRTQIPDMLQVFDAPKIVFNCTRRNVSTTPLQSLTLMNSEFILTRSEELADRLLLIPNDSTRLQQAFEIVYNRLPSQEEVDLIEQFLSNQTVYYQDDPNPLRRAWSDCCQMLLASNEFLYLQ